jgi:hypothetical protein
MADGSGTARQVTFNIAPIGDPGAQDFYGNLTGVGTTPTDIVLVFAQLVPEAKMPDADAIDIRPKVRITLPPAAAARLREQLEQQLSLRASIEASPKGRSE